MTAPAQVVAEELFRVNNSEYLQEGVTAFYLQAEAGLFRNRLKILTGVRFEKTSAKGEGVLADPNAVWQRDADGTYAHTAAGARIRKPAAGTVGSAEELRLIRAERGVRAARTYEGYYPSIHLTYNIRENLQARASFAQTYGLPDFTNIVPNSTIDEADMEAAINPQQLPGRITIRNTGKVAAQLISRHWVISDGNNQVQEVRGLGVVGAQPLIKPEESFEYTSGTALATPVGTMHGTYQMVAEDGTSFEAPIPAFTLSVPRVLH